MRSFVWAVVLALLLSTILLWGGVLGANYTTSFIERWEATIGMRPTLILPPPKTIKKANKLVRFVRV